MTKRFVAITAAAMYACLDAIGTKIKAAGGNFVVTTHGREVVYELYHHAGHQAIVRVYTSIAKGATEVRDCDSDAVRLVIGCYSQDGTFRPLGKSRKILRTARNDVEDREQAFLDRLTQAIREAYVDIKTVPICPRCGAPMALRKPTKKSKKEFKPFFGCVDFPNCKGSRAA